MPVKRRHGFDAYQVNTFCTSTLTGNPAGVCLINEAAGSDASWMQTVAARFAFSETAFVHRERGDRYHIRWFSPKKEMFLCGHPTLASAHILFELGIAKGKSIQFQGLKERLTATRLHEGIELDLPAIVCERAPVPAWFESAFKIQPMEFLQGPNKYMAVVTKELNVLELKPDFELLRKVADRGVIVTSRASTAPYDIVSRYFAAYTGVDEDPVTGAAHCCMGPYWSPRLGKMELFAIQASTNGGELRVQTAGDRVYLTGNSITISHHRVPWIETVRAVKSA